MIYQIVVYEEEIDKIKKMTDFINKEIKPIRLKIESDIENIFDCIIETELRVSELVDLLEQFKVTDYEIYL